MNGTQMKLFTSSSLDLPESSEKWSENIVVLGKGVPSWSRKYKQVIYCIAGMGEVSGWLRLYPVSSEIEKPIEKFDIIQVVIRKDHPERYRPESRKIFLEDIKKVGHIKKESARKKFLQQYMESGQFLHNQSWRHRSLGIIQPISPYFWITKENKLRVRYRCNAPRCNGHTNDVTEFTTVDRVGRRRLIPQKILEEKLHQLEGQELYFVMGTVSYHPHRWILIEIHDFKRKR